MNAKKAKSLRKMLRGLVDQHPEQIPVHAFTTVRNSSKDIYVEKEKEDGSKGVEKVTVFEGQVCAAPKSQRGVYLRLKKELNKVV